eukprot:4242433-Alexandrium_andersonii.AAC.1
MPSLPSGPGSACSPTVQGYGWPFFFVVRKETFQREASQLPCPALQVFSALLNRRISVRRIPAEPFAELR